MRSIQTDTTPTNSAQDLTRDFQAVVADAQELLEAVGDTGGAKLDAMKSRVLSSLKVARQHLADAQANVAQGIQSAAKSTDEYVHANPWPAIGVSAALGLLAGYAIARR
ncbi:MAG TPA: DUF883 family protein [Usitatibacter sp.]|nr:DUF883 family protein [Usitatibacter sp.]